MAKRGPVRVKVTWREDRGYYVLRWTEPRNRKPREAATEPRVTTKREALRQALAKEDELAQVVVETTWAKAIERWESDKLPSETAKSRACWVSALNRLQEYRIPARLDDLSGEFLSKWSGWLHGQHLAAATIAGYLREIRRFSRWAAGIWTDYRPPKVTLPLVADPAKGRPVTAEEFDRMLGSVQKVVGRDRAKAWRRFLRGLWWSGLRLSEALHLTWGRYDRLSVFEVDGPCPVYRIPGAAQKSRRTEVLPIAPEFVQFLRRIPESRRRGRVFRGLPSGIEEVSSTITAIGRKAGVVVATKRKRDRKSGKVGPGKKFASAHDLRRAFGTRWSVRVKPPVLKQMMRHRDLKTTMDYYVDLDAETLAGEIWAAMGDKLGDKPAENTTDSGRSRKRKPELPKSVRVTDPPELGN